MQWRLGAVGALFLVLLLAMGTVMAQGVPEYPGQTPPPDMPKWMEGAPGDRIVFLENNRDLGVKNGMLGTVESVEAGRIVAQLDGKGGDSISVPMGALDGNGRSIVEIAAE